MEGVLDFLGLPPHPLQFEVHNSREYEEMDEKTRLLLEQFYQPHNEHLFDILGRRFDDW